MPKPTKEEEAVLRECRRNATTRGRLLESNSSFDITFFFPFPVVRSCSGCVLCCYLEMACRSRYAPNSSSFMLRLFLVCVKITGRPGYKANFYYSLCRLRHRNLLFRQISFLSDLGRVPRHFQRWSRFYYIGAFIGSYEIGVISYRLTCMKKILALENSPLADKIRERMKQMWVAAIS